MRHKTSDLSGLTVRQLRTRRRRLASGLSDVEALLRGTLVSQGRRCGKENCRCASGDLHGPYTYLSVPRPGGRPRLVYVPADLVETVAGQVAAAVRVEAALAEITAINAELLARRAPG
jgi:transposase